MFDVRIVNVDHYMATPFRGFDPVYSDFRGTSVSQVPVIRIFGSTASGKKTCLHIHGVFPYIYVPFDGELDPSQQMYQLAASLDKALNIALGTANSARQHIYKVVHVKGVPFYGYHEKSHQFLKIYFYNPLIVKKATDLLQNGAVCNKIFQCHEAHLPFILQFFIDYNLHGMSFIQLASVDFRQEPGTIHSNLGSDLRPAKTTYCELEVDGLASDILNRKTISDGEVANPGLAGIWSEERLRNDVSQLSQNQSQERPAAKKTLSEVLLRQRLREALDELSGRISGGSASTVLYPAESTPGDHVQDASLVEGLCNNCTEHDVSTFMVQLDDSVIDEQLVLSLSQAPTNSQDLSLLDMMQSLAERGAESCETEEDWMPSASQKSAEALLSQSFHCSNMEADSILGAASPNAVADEECPQSLEQDETAEKEDCWQDSIWNGLDFDDIPQLDGAPDECDEGGGGGRDTPSTRRQTRQKLMKNRNKPVKNLDSTIKTPSRVSSPIVIDSSEDDSYMACTPMNIFNQERFWCDKKDNTDSELENLMFGDTMTLVPSMKSEIYDEPPENFTGGANNSENVDSTYANVLMRGDDPSLTCLAEASSEDFTAAILNESNDPELNENSKNRSILEEEANLDTSFTLNLEESSLASQETCLELDDDSDEIVTSSQFIFNLDCEYDTIEDQVGEESNETSETATKRKPKKRDKDVVKNRLSDRGATKINESKSKPNSGNRKKHRNLVKVVSSNEEQSANVECDGGVEIVEPIDGNLLAQDDVELNNNDKRKKHNREFGNRREKSCDDNILARLSDERCENMDLKISFPSSETVHEDGSHGTGNNSENMESPRKKQKKTSRSGECVKKARKNSVNEGDNNSENTESPSKKQKKIIKSGECVNEICSVNKINKKTLIDTGNDDDDDFRINFKLKTKTQNYLVTDKSISKKSESKSPSKAAAHSSLISTELKKENDQSDSKVLFPCYFFKSNGVIMKFNFPFKQTILSEKTKRRFLERRKRFASVLLPTVDHRIQPSNLEDDYLTREMIEEYIENQKSSEDQSSVDLSEDVQNGSNTPKKVKMSDSSDPKNIAGSSNPSPKTGVKSSDKQVSSNRVLSPALKCGSDRKDSLNSVANSSVSSPKKSQIRKSLDFGLKSEAKEYGNNSPLGEEEMTGQIYLPDCKSHSSPSKAKLTQNKAKSSPKKAAKNQTESYGELEEVELSENDINQPNKIRSPNSSAKWQATGSSRHKKNTPKKAAKKAILKPSPIVKRELESPNKTEKQSLNTPSLNSVKKGSPNKDASNNRDDKVVKISPKSRKPFKISNLEKYIRLYNIKPCRVLVDRLPENVKAVKKLFSKQKKEHPVSKPEQSNSVNSVSKLPQCSTPTENSPVTLNVNEDLANCSQMDYDVLQVPFSDFKVDEQSISDPDMEDSHKLSMLVRQNPIEFKLSVRLDRIDQSMFLKSNQKHESFKIDNLDGSFGDDIESSSDDDVPITPSRKILDCKKTDSGAKRSHSTPRPRYRPLKVKITKSPPKKSTKPLPPCWVLLKRLNFDNDKGSSSDTVANSLDCLGGDSKNPNPVDDGTSSHSTLSGSDGCDIFGEVLSQPEPKTALNLELDLGLEGKDLKSSNLSKVVSNTSQKSESNSETMGRVASQSIGDQLLLNKSRNNDDSSENNSFHNRNASPVTLESKNESTMKKYMSMPGPSTSTAPPWYNADVYDSYSSSDEKEDKGILSFYNTSVYFPENDSDSEKTIYEILSLDDECSELSGEEYKTYIPKTRPPTHNEILSSLSNYDLTKVLNREPFCSDISDRASTEVGPVSLKLKSRSAIDLEEYDGPFSKGVCMYRNNLLKSLQTKRSSVLAGDRDVVLVPLRRPPSCEQVRKWLKVKTKLETETKKLATDDDKCEQLERLIVPCSPGQNCGSDDEQNTLVLTPMSPPSRTHSTPSDCPPGGSLPITDTPPCTPVVPLLPSRRQAKRKSSDILKKSSAKLLKDYAAMSSIHENEAESVLSQKDDGNLQLSDSSICISIETRENMEAQLKNKVRLSSSFQIEACHSDNTSGLPTRIDNLQKTRPQIQHQFLTLMILELHVQTRGDLLPDPENDPIRAVFYHIVNDVPKEAETSTTLTGIIAVGHLVPEDENVSVTCVSDEMALLVALVELIRNWDPDMFIGYEIEKLSWGFLIERAYTLGMNLNIELSRVMGAEGASKYEDDQGMLGGDSEHLDIRLAGRIVLNVWRLLRHEVALQSYTFENIMYHVLRRRIPLFSFRSLSAWWEHRTQLYRWMTVDHYLVRVRGVAEILDHLDFIGRTSELARLFGIQFYEVLSRGSQFRVESMMLRMAKPESYVAVSPTTKQRAHMRAPESLPLIMEPESRFYSDPVIVLDFQSLYPSIIIAHNYCFSTCLGRVENLAKSELFDFGCTHLRVPFSTVKKIEENLNFSPCGVAFVNSSVRRGVLPRMLQEILETRLMVKRSMKKNKNNKALHRVLHNRQLGLKLIANVTYGYTSANFSGRMPCIEIGDSVVSKGRETLERAIALVNRTERWGARVVYGDTDSLFVLVAGRSRADAFQIGAEIAEAVTAENPKPVKLKLEKVYQPCILQTKKRYVGHMWESPDEETPTYDAKGIETVRRDGCPAVAKILQKSLQLLFETKDVSIVKRFVLHQFGKVSSGRISIQELTFAREYRGARGYKPGACVPALELARSWMKRDRRSEPRVGERVPYVIVSGPPGLPLIRLVRSPRAVLADAALKVNADYYITRVIIPPLNRCLLLVGANALNWFTSMPRRQPPSLPSAVPSGARKATISQYFATVSCAVCHDQACTTGVCDTCRARPQTVAVSLAAQLHAWERRRHLVLRVCQSCCGRTNNIDCMSLDCPVLYARADAERQLAHEPVFRRLQQEYFNCDF